MMQFLFPNFLYATGAIAIPVVIHLFNFRRYKKIVFSDIRFLKQIQEETKSRHKLKELLILLSRILAICSLVFAFAQPFIPHSADHVSTAKAVSVFVDNSFSMGTEDRNGSLLETAKQKARSIINALGNDEEFQILTNDFEGRQQRLLSKADALRAIDNITLSSSSQQFSSVLIKQKQALENVTQNKFTSYIISDFQKSFIEQGDVISDTTLSLKFIPVQTGAVHNIFIDSAWLASPVIKLNTPVKLNVRIRNSSDEDAEGIAVTLKLNNMQKALVNLNCTAQSYADGQLTFTLNNDGWQAAELSIIDHPISFDDKLFFSIRPVSNSNILCINSQSENKFINRLFEGDPYYILTNSNQNQLDYSSFARKQLIILNEPASLSTGLSDELKKYVENGGYLLVIPPVELQPADLNNFLSALRSVTLGPKTVQLLKADQINTKEEFFNNEVFQKIPRQIDLPAVSQYYQLLKSQATSGVTLMQLNNGLPFIYQSGYKKGKVLTLCSPLNEEWTNLQQHSIFVPLMLKLATGNFNYSRIYYTIDHDKWINADINWQETEKTARIYGNDLDMLCDVKLRDGKSEIFIDQQIKKAGIYSVEKKDERKTEMLAGMNYDRAESYTQLSDIKQIAGDVAEVINDEATVLGQKIMQEHNGKQLWRVFAILALLFVLIEILLLKLL